jgi:hypothetical protein
MSFTAVNRIPCADCGRFVAVPVIETDGEPKRCTQCDIAEAWTRWFAKRPPQVSVVS